MRKKRGLLFEEEDEAMLVSDDMENAEEVARAIMGMEQDTLKDRKDRRSDRRRPFHSSSSSRQCLQTLPLLHSKTWKEKRKKKSLLSPLLLLPWQLTI